MLRIVPVNRLTTGFASLSLCVGLDNSGVGCKALAAYQSFRHATTQYALEQMPERAALAKAAMPVLGELRVIRHGIVQTQPAEPAIGQIEMYLFTQATLGPNTEAVADDQHANHQLGINRGAPCGTVVVGQMFAQIAKIKKVVNTTQQMILRNVAIEVKSVK